MSLYSRTTHRARQIINGYWNKPDTGYASLNVDGAVIKNRAISCSGFVSNRNGDWLCGFSKSICN